MLQDPSGSIGAGIHAQVLQAEEGLSPGAVLMLQQVALTAVSTSSSTPFVPLSGWLSLNERGQVAPSAFPLLTFDVACQVPLLVLSKTLKYLCITVENIVQVRAQSCTGCLLHNLYSHMSRVADF